MLLNTSCLTFISSGLRRRRWRRSEGRKGEQSWYQSFAFTSCDGCHVSRSHSASLLSYTDLILEEGMQSESCHRGGERQVQTTEEYFAKSCVCVCLSAWCVSDLLVVRVCMCVCTFNSMLLYNFFPPSVENLSHFGCFRKGWEFKCWYSDFFCDPLTGLQVTSSLQSLKNKTRKCNCPSVWGLDCARTQMEVQCLNFYLIHSKSVSVCFFVLFFFAQLEKTTQLLCCFYLRFEWAAGVWTFFQSRTLSEFVWCVCTLLFFLSAWTLRNLQITFSP